MSTRAIQAIRHTTVENGSDHDAILLELNLTNDGRTVRVKAGSWNMGNGTMADLGELMVLLGPRAFLCLQEAGGQLDRILGEAARHDYRLLSRTDEVGAASTIVLVGPGLTAHAAVTHRLLPSQFVGRGAGPDHNKPKVANGGRVSCDGVVFGVFSAHQLASLQNPLRFRHGKVWATALGKATFGKRVPWVVGADWNTDLGKEGAGLTRWLLAHGWTTDQQQLEVEDTHGRRAIDGFGWRKLLNVAPEPPLQRFGGPDPDVD